MKLPKCIAASMIEVGYVTEFHAVEEALWLSQLVCTFRQVDLNLASIVFIDMQGVVELSKKLAYNKALKHIKVRYQFVRDCVTKGKLGLENVSIVDNVVDGMIKCLLANQFRLLKQLMSVTTFSAQPTRAAVFRLSRFGTKDDFDLTDSALDFDHEEFILFSLICYILFCICPLWVSVKYGNKMDVFTLSHWTN